MNAMAHPFLSRAMACDRPPTTGLALSKSRERQAARSSAGVCIWQEAVKLW